MDETTVKAELKELSGELTALAVKGIGCTQEERTRFNEIQPRIIILRETLATAAAMAAADGDNKAFLQQSAGGILHPTGIPGQHNVNGFKTAGGMEIDRETHRILSDIGLGVNPKQEKAFRTNEYRSAFNEWLRRKGSYRDMTADSTRTLQEGLDTEGGYLLPEDFLAQLIQKKPTPTRVADFCSQFSTSVDRKIIPKVIYTTDDLYTTGMRITWVGENPGSATAARVTDPVFGTVSIPVYTAMMSLPITKDLLEDAAFNVEDWIVGKFRETYDLLRDNMVLNGLGTNQPTGILQNVGGTSPGPVGPAYVATGNANTLTADGFINTSFAIPEQYDENCRWVMNKTNTAKAAATLKDGTGRYLWGMGLQDSGLAPGGLGNAQRMMNGYPVNFSGFMPNVASNAYPALFGDFSGYYLVNRVGMTVQILNELYAEQNYVVLLGRLRFGGQLAEEWKLKALKVSVS